MRKIFAILVIQHLSLRIVNETLTDYITQQFRDAVYQLGISSNKYCPKKSVLVVVDRGVISLRTYPIDLLKLSFLSNHNI